MSDDIRSVVIVRRADRLIATAASATGDPWMEVFRSLWATSMNRLTPLMNDIVHRGTVVIPIEARYDEDGTFRVTDGHHRVAVAYALGMYLPVNVTLSE